MYYTYYIILRIILCIIFTYDFKTIRPKSNSIIHNTQYNTYYGLIRIMYCHTLVVESRLDTINMFLWIESPRALEGTL